MITSRFTQPRILVVANEPPITRVLELILNEQGYPVECTHDGQEALARFEAWRPALVIADLYMPHMSGLELCRRVRARSTVPIIVLSVKDQEPTIVEALNAGADDCLAKPFATEELLARVRARLRRSSGHWDAAPFAVGDFRIDVPSRRVSVRGTAVRLTPNEFDLLVYFAQRPNTLLTHHVLLDAVWGDAGFERPEYLRVFIGQLRKKCERDPSNPRYFVTEPLKGYHFNPLGETAS